MGLGISPKKTNVFFMKKLTDIIGLTIFVRFSFPLLNPAVFYLHQSSITLDVWKAAHSIRLWPSMVVLANMGPSMVILSNASTVFSFNPHLQSVLTFPMKQQNCSNWELVSGKMSKDLINPVRFLHVVCDFGFEIRILLHISWWQMLGRFVKVVAML